MAYLLDSYNYGVVIILMMIGLYTVFSSRNLIKKLVGLSVFQTSVFLLYISIGKVAGGQPPILVGGHGDAKGGDYGADHGGDKAGGYADAYASGGAHAGEAYASTRASDTSSDTVSDPVSGSTEDVITTIVESAGHSADHGAGHAEVLYSNPLPHVLILTAIVVGVATLAIGLALVVRIRELYGSIEEDEINQIDYAYNLEGTDA